MKRDCKIRRCVYRPTVLLLMLVLMSACNDAARKTNSPDLGSLTAPTFITETGEETSGPVAISMAENTLASTEVSMFAEDVDGNAINWKVSITPAKGTVVMGPDNAPGNSKTLSYIPLVDATGEDVFEVAIDDGTGFIDTMMVNVTIVALDLFVSVDVSGYTTGNTMILQLNGKNDISISSDGTYAFSEVLNSGDSYNVTATTAAEKFKTSCILGNAKGTMSSASKTNVALVCTDDIAPAIANKSPAGGEKDVALDTVINAVFDEAMLATSIGAEAISLAESVATDNGATISGTANYNETSRTLSFAPAAPLALLRPYTVTLSSNMMDISGQSLVSSPWTFTTRDGEWGTDKIIVKTTNKSLLGGVQIAMNSVGQGFAIWVQDDGTGVDSQRFHLYSTRFDPESNSWSSARRIDDDYPGFRLIDNMQIALDSDGRGLAVWSQMDAQTTTIRSKQFAPVLNEWEDKSVPISDGQANFNSLQLAVNSSGQGIAVWSQFDGTEQSISANYFDSVKKKWRGFEYIENNSGDTGSSQIAINSEGQGLAVWVQPDSSGVNNIWASYFDPDPTASGWLGAELIGRTEQGQGAVPQIAFNSSGQGIAVWVQHDVAGTQTNIWANSFDAETKAWGNMNEAVLIETINGNVSNPQIAMDSLGRGLSVWSQVDETKQSSIFANHFDPVTKEWNGAMLIESNPRLPRDAQIALDPAGQGIAVWTQFDDSGEFFIWANRFDSANKSWGNAEIIGAGVSGLSYPKIALDAMGHGIAMWRQGFFEIGGNRFE